MCPDQFWINRTNFGVIFGPAEPILVAKIGPDRFFPWTKFFVTGQTDSSDAKFSLRRVGWQEKNSGHYRGWTVSKRTLSRVGCRSISV